MDSIDNELQKNIDGIMANFEELRRLNVESLAYNSVNKDILGLIVKKLDNILGEITYKRDIIDQKY